MINGFIVAMLLDDQFNDREASMLTYETRSWLLPTGFCQLKSHLLITLFN